MRFVLDTNILVRAAADEHGLAGRLLHEVLSGPHVLVNSPYLLSEVARVLSYPRLQARWQLSEKTIADFVTRVGDVSAIVLTTAGDHVVLEDPDDDPIVQTAVLGGAQYLCTRDTHLLESTVVEYCAAYGITVTNDIALYRILTGRSKSER